MDYREWKESVRLVGFEATYMAEERERYLKSFRRLQIAHAQRGSTKSIRAYRRAMDKAVKNITLLSKDQNFDQATMDIYYNNLANDCVEIFRELSKKYLTYSEPISILNVLSS